MTPEHLKAGIARAYGPRGGSAFCRDTGINRSTLYRWQAGEQPIPKWVGMVLEEQEYSIRDAMGSIRRQFANDFLTIQGFSAYHGIHEQHASDILDVARRIEEAPHPDE